MKVLPCCLRSSGHIVWLTREHAVKGTTSTSRQSKSSCLFALPPHDGTAASARSVMRWECRVVNAPGVKVTVGWLALVSSTWTLALEDTLVIACVTVSVKANV